MMEARLSTFHQQMNRLRTFLETGKYEKNETVTNKRNLRNQTKTHILEGRFLKYTGEIKKGPRLVVTDIDTIKDILYEYHTTPLGGHSGINGTLDKISRSYIWNGMKADVKDYVSACSSCQTNKKNKPAAPVLKPIKVKEPLELVVMDLIGPLPTTKKGNQYVLSMTDYFTKFVELFALPKREATGISSCIKTFIRRWGAPKRFLSDQGRDFCKKINKELLFTLEIKQCVASACHLQTNGLDKWTNEVVKMCISELSGENGEGWDEELEDVAFSIRTQTQASAKFSPFFLMFGRQALNPFEMEETKGFNYTPYVDEKDREAIDVNQCEGEADGVVRKQKVKTKMKEQL